MKKITLLLFLLIISGCSNMPSHSEEFRMREAQTEHFSLPVWEKAPLESGKVIRFILPITEIPHPQNQPH